MVKQGCIVLVVLALSACQRTPVPVPPFTVTVDLDPVAAATIASLHEGIVVAAVFEGDGESNGTRPALNRGVFLGMADVEAGPNGAARFAGLNLPAEEFRRLRSPDYTVSVSVFSARRSGPENLLSCGYVEGRISDVARTGLRVRCGAIR